jgi:hypothetical protein
MIKIDNDRGKCVDTYGRGLNFLVGKQRVSALRSMTCKTEAVDGVLDPEKVQIKFSWSLARRHGAFKGSLHEF